MPVPRIEADCLRATGVTLKEWLIQCSEKRTSMKTAGVKFGANDATICKYVKKYGIKWASAGEMSRYVNQVKYRGVWDSKAGHCRRYGLSIDSVRRMYRYYGMSFADAMDKQIRMSEDRKVGIVVEWRGFVDNIKGHCEREGINHKKFYSMNCRRRLGLIESLEYAAKRAKSGT